MPILTEDMVALQIQAGVASTTPRPSALPSSRHAGRNRSGRCRFSLSGFGRTTTRAAQGILAFAGDSPVRTNFEGTGCGFGVSWDFVQSYVISLTESVGITPTS